MSLLLVMLLMCGIQAWGQSQASTGQITGSVKDAAGAVVSGASVKVTNTATGFTQTLTTGDEGLYRAVLLPPGPYTVEISKEGFTSSKADVEVGVGRTTDVNASLAVGARKDEVTVTAEAIEASRHEAAAFVGATVIANIPLNGRRFQDIVNTTPAAQTDPSRGGISMTGQRMVNTGSIHVDGADYGQLFFGGIRGGERAQFAPTIPLDSIQEFQIVRSGYSAEFGRSTGGVITAITKSGTNALHGSAGYVIRPSSAGKSNEYYETTASQLKTSGCTTCVVNPNPTLHQWGGSVGGPVKKDKLFFFGSYDQQRQRIPHQVFFGNIATFTPTAATTEAYTYYKSLEVPFEQTNDAWLFLVKGDYLINDHHRLSVRYNHSNYEGVNANSVGTSLSPTVTAALSNNGTEIDKTRTVVGNLTSYFSTFANEFRVQYAKEIRPRVANAQAPTVSNGGVGNFGTTSFLGQNEEHDYRVELVNNLTRIKGAHTLKLGFEYNHIFATQLFGFNQHGSFGSASSDTTGWLTSLGTRWNDTNARYTHQLGNLQATMAGEQFAAFVQDAWKVRPNLTINYGLRWEGALNPSGVGSNAMYPLVKGFVFPDNHNEDPAKIPNQLKQFAPRLGFAWDPMGNGKTVIRGFGGIYFASTPLILYAASVNNFREPPGDLSVQLGNGGLKGSAGVTVPGCPGNLGGSLTACDTVYEMFQIVGIDLKTVPLDKLPDLTIDQVKQIAGTIAAANGSAFNPYSGASPYFTDNDYKNPRSYQAGFGIEREISKGWTAGVDASWIKTVNLQRDRDLNINRSVSTDIAGRPLYNTGARPISGLSAVVIRDSTAKGLYRSMTVKSSFKRKFGEVNAYYTLSENLDDDYQERNATGIQYMDQFNPASDYGFSDLDRKHQFVAQPVFFLPWSFEVSGAIRFVTGAPFTSTVGSDLNKDGTNNDRPYLAVGVPMERNAFRNRSFSNFDLRVQKNIKITESKHIRLSAEMFNLFNSMNLTYASRNLNYCSANGGTTLQSVTTCGISSFQNAAVNGWTLNSNFMQLRDTRTATAGQLLTNNNVGVPFEAQFSFKFVF